MDVYLVGGAVRDTLMGLSPKDRDFVVVGASPQQMLDEGYMQVGADFPVYLHPTTGDEYALARIERKTSTGYLGFETEIQGVTLEQDLSRRDLTINAMAFDAAQVLVDPFGGRCDLDNKVLRHVGPAFAEDPVRILRLLRFRARFGPMWSVAPETWALLKRMVADGAAHHLVAERVWQEVSRALMEPFSELFVQGLQDLGLLGLPAFRAYPQTSPKGFAAMASAQWPELALAGRFAVVFKQPTAGLLPPPGIPQKVWRLSELSNLFDRPPGTAEDWMDVLTRCTVAKDPSRFEELVSVWSCKGHPPALGLTVLKAVQSVDIKRISRELPPGPAVGQAIRLAQLEAVRSVLT